MTRSALFEIARQGFPTTYLSLSKCDRCASIPDGDELRERLQDGARDIARSSASWVARRHEILMQPLGSWDRKGQRRLMLPAGCPAAKREWTAKSRVCDRGLEC